MLTRKGLTHIVSHPFLVHLTRSSPSPSAGIPHTHSRRFVIKGRLSPRVRRDVSWGSVLTELVAAAAPTGGRTFGGDIWRPVGKRSVSSFAVSDVSQ